MKESFRFLKDEIKVGYDIIFIARTTINDKKFFDVKKSMYNALRKAKLHEK
jgi:ribonuclease P protein component